MTKPETGKPGWRSRLVGRLRKLRWFAVAVVVAHTIGFVSSIHAVMGTRSSQAAIAWVVSLNSVPYVAVPAYWVFARDKFQGYVSARRRQDDLLAPLKELDRQAIRAVQEPADRKTVAWRVAERLAKLPALTGNRAELLIDGEATFASILEGIDAAEDYILIQFFIVKDDELGRRVQSHLIEKARQGVRVYFLYDEVGSHALPERYKRELREAGAEIVDFHTRKGPGNRFQINFRNHRKIVVVDGKTSWIGGHNIGDEYLGKDPTFGRWRDTHVRIDGPAALAAQLAFLEDWYWATDRVVDVNWTPTVLADGPDTILIVPSGPADRLDTAALMFVHAINSAQERLWIASPYFVPDEAVVSALQLAGLRGVDVRVMIPEKADHLPVWLAAFSYFDESSMTGVRFCRYTDGFLHQKAALVDDRVAAVGTANFDNRSFRLNFEITALMRGESIVRDVERMFEEDFRHCTPVAADEYTGKSFLFRLGVRLARLTAPIQ